MSFAWLPDPQPPAPQGVVGAGAVARRLLLAIEQAPSAARAGWLAAANDDVLVLTGAELPWADGVQYIAPRTHAPALWLPTAECPALPLDLLERALLRRCAQTPLLLLRTPAQVVPLARLLPVGAGLLRQIRTHWGEPAGAPA